MQIIVDANSICHRMKHTMGSLSHQEKLVGIIFGFLRQILSIAKRFDTNQFIFCWDSRSRKRTEICPTYKANRHKELTEEEEELNTIAYTQFDELRKVILPKLGFKNNFFVEGYEADDLIARIVKDNGYQFIIVSTDNDLYQLLSPRISMVTDLKKPLYTEEAFQQEYNLTVDQWAFVKAIAGCFDEKTDILTNEGWKRFEDLKGSELVYSMNPTTREAFFCPIKRIIKYYYDGIMYKITGDLVDLLVTPDHKLIGKPVEWERSNSKPLITKKVKDIKGCFSIPIVSKWNPRKRTPPFFTLPKYKNYCYMPNGGKRFWYLPEINIKIEDWVAFLGIWLAEGSVGKDRNGSIGAVSVFQKKGAKNDKIRELLLRLPFKWCELKNGGFCTQSVQLGKYLHQLGNTFTKFIPNEIKNYSSHVLQILIEWMILGDGGVSKEGKAIAYWTSNERLANDFQEVICKIGKASSIFYNKARVWKIRGKEGLSKPNFTICIHSSRTLNLIHKKIDQIPYTGFVYDVETEPHHTIFVRRNGKAIWSSNCSGDNVIGVEGVGIKTATAFLHGRLARNLKYKAIDDAIAAGKINLNMRLVLLPFEGTPNFILKEDQLSLDGFLDVASKYNFQSFLQKDNLKVWKKVIF